MPGLKILIVCGLLIVLVCGCTHMNRKHTTSLAPTRDILHSIATVGIVEPPVAGYTTQHAGKGFIEETAGAAFSGTLLLASPIGAFATMYVLYTAGSVGEAFVTPKADGDTRNPLQIQASLDTFNAVLTTTINNNRGLQSALVSEGNKLPSYSFIVLDEQAAVPELMNPVTNPAGKAVDALLKVSSLSIVFAGKDIPLEKDPELQLKVSFKLLLKSTDVRPRCLGWYAGDWEGKRLRVSEWAEADGAQLETGITTAFNALSQEALRYLFTPSHNYFHFHLFNGTVTAPNWSDCSVKDPYKRLLTDVASYCPQADQGNPEFQRRIGNVFYNESHLSRKNLVHAYVWYRLAARNNDEIASDRIRMLASMLTLDELEEAEKQRNEWKPGQCINELAEAGLLRPQ